MMRRRAFLAGTASVMFAPYAARAQARPPLVAIFVAGSREAAGFDGFFAGMAELGFIAGRDYQVIEQWMEGDTTRAVAIAQELVALGPSVLVCGSSGTALPARQATSTIPIVAQINPKDLADLVGPSFARPAGNVTGIVGGAASVVGKQLQLLKEAVPSATVVGWINAGSVSLRAEFAEEMEGAARSLGVRLVAATVATAADVVPAFELFVRERVDGVVMVTSSLLNAEVRRAVNLATTARLPAIGNDVFGVGGGLMGYGLDNPANRKQLASFVVAILRGARIADLPVQDAARYQLSINLGVARALGVNIPGPLLARADVVIE